MWSLMRELFSGLNMQPNGFSVSNMGATRLRTSQFPMWKRRVMQPLSGSRLRKCSLPVMLMIFGIFFHGIAPVLMVLARFPNDLRNTSLDRV